MGRDHWTLKVSFDNDSSTAYPGLTLDSALHEARHLAERDLKKEPWRPKLRQIEVTRGDD